MAAIKHVFHDVKTNVVFDVLNQTSAAPHIQVQNYVSGSEDICISIRDLVRQEMRCAL